MKRAAPLALALGATACGSRTGLLIPDTVGPRDSGVEAAPPPPQPASCVLYGGFLSAQGTDTDKGWRLSGNTWLPLPTVLSPPECAGQCGYDGAAVDAGGRLLFILAASTSGAIAMQTFAWDGVSLTEVTTSNAPPARFRGAVAAISDKVVMFGGVPPAGPFSFMSDTWILEGSAWTPINTPVAPSPRGRAAATAVGGKMVIFGGADSSGVLGDTWVFDGASWSPGPGQLAPSARSDATMATVGGAGVMFGGCVGGGYTGCSDIGTSSAETWQWDPTAGWTPLHPAASPPARNYASMTTVGTSALLVGGFAGPQQSVTLDDAWMWNGAWTPAPFAAPLAAGGSALACE